MKKTLSVLLAICLAMGLLPVAALADAPNAKVTLAGKTLAISAYDTPAYSVNVTSEVLDTEDNKFTAVGQTLTGAGEENWNAKFVWKTGDPVPTLYLKGFQVDEYNEETNKWKARYQNAEERQDPEKKGMATKTAAVNIPTGQAMNIVITGEDSVIKCRFGITYKSPLNIQSEGTSKLTIQNLSSAITSDINEAQSKGYTLNINANLDISVQSYYNGAASHMIQTYKADLTIEGGNINIDTPADNFLLAIAAREGGNVHIKGGKITAVSAAGTASTNGAIQANKGKIIVDGGDLTLKPKHDVGMYATEGIEINGGKVYILSPYYAINAGTSDKPADIVINGGTVEFEAERACYSKVIKLGSGVQAYVGTNKEKCEVYDGSNPALLTKPWMIFSNEKLDIVVTEPTENIQIFIPPTSATTAPTTAPTQAATAPAANAGNQTESGDSTVLLIVAAAIVLLAGAAVAVVLVKRKKA